MARFQTLIAAVFCVAGLCLALPACTTPTEALQSGAQANGAQVTAATAVPPAAGTQDAEAAATPEQPETAKILNQKSTVAQKGTFIRVLVNGDPITNYDIQRRSKFRQLRRLSASQDETIKELVDERIKMSAARERGSVATDAQVDEAFANFAKSNKSTPARISGDLDRIGIGAEHFKEYIRAQITWNRLASAKLQQQTQQKSQSAAIFELRKAGQAKPETTEYLLQQVVFVIPKDKIASLAKARTAEALAFRQQYTGCANAIKQATGLKDVAVKELGRSLQPELPPLWAEKVKATGEGQLTEPQTTEKGVEMIGICRAKVTNDDRAAQVLSQAQAYESLEQKGDAAADEYLAELRKTATIVYR